MIPLKSIADDPSGKGKRKMSLTKREIESDPSFWQDYSTWSDEVAASDEEIDRWVEERQRCEAQGQNEEELSPWK